MILSPAKNTLIFPQGLISKSIRLKFSPENAH